MAPTMLRHLKLTRDGGISDVPVSIDWPVFVRQTWACRWTIDWPDRQRENVGYGVDALQAIFNALQMVGTEIYCSEEHKSGRLRWNDEMTGYGFPVPNGIRDLLIGDDAKYL